MTELGLALALALPPLTTEEVEEFLLSNGGRACSDIVGDGYVICMLFWDQPRGNPGEGMREM